MEINSVLELDAIKEKIWDTYIALSNLPQPESYRLGGTFYGGTELYRSVGNMLDPINGEPYISYGYGGSTHYDELWGIRIGGVYNAPEIVKELRDYIKEVRQTIFDAGWAIVDDYGTNFSVIGIARR